MRKAVMALSVFWATLIIVGAAFAKEEKSSPFLGVYVDEVTSKIAEDYGVKAGEGVLVTGTVDGSAAEEIGLRANDILLKVNGASLTGPAELRLQIKKHKVGDKIEVTFKRGGKTKSADAELTSRENESMFFSKKYDKHFVWNDEDLPENVKVWVSDDDDKETAFAGIVTQELGDGLQEYFKVKTGALISEVVKDSPAEAAGLKAGDVILKIGKRDIDDQNDVGKAIRKNDPGDEVEFVIMRKGSQKTFKVTLTSRAEYYGSVDIDEIRLGLDAEREEIEGMIRMRDGELRQFSYDLTAEMEELNKSLEELDIEFEELPDVQMDLSIDPVAPIIEMNFDQARAIRNDVWWKQSWNEVKDRLEEEFEELKADFQRLKDELKQLQEEFKQRLL